VLITNRPLLTKLETRLSPALSGPLAGGTRGGRAGTVKSGKEIPSNGLYPVGWSRCKPTCPSDPSTGYEAVRALLRGQDAF
jgi:hypothetical protein